MIRLEFTIADVDYDALAELLVPRLKQSATFGAMLPGGVTTDLVKRWLATLSREKKEQLTVELLNANREKLMGKAGVLLQQQGLSLNIVEAKASRIK